MLKDKNSGSLDPVAEIKARLPIETLVAEYLDLKSAGINLKAVCPFHSEKTPSFMVSPERRSWHCFGCDKGGDVFSFVMEMEGLEFKEALKVLAKKAGVELPVYRADNKKAGRTGRLLEINALAAEFFQKELRAKSADAAPARAELKKRKVDDLTADTFKVGFARDSWEALLSSLSKRGFSEDEQVAAGLVIKRLPPKQGAYDRFRNRLMFPLVDVLDRVLGFTARTLDPEEKMGKYINSPETEIYHKGQFLFGLNLAKTAIRKKDFVILVEGQMDVISSYRVGVKNVVASSGTALTAQQLGLLKRYTSNLVLAFDVDLAGASATKKGIDLALASGFNVKIAKMPRGVDPDDLCCKDPKGWARALGGSQNIIDYYLRQSTEGRDLEQVETKKVVGRVVLPEIARLQDSIEQTHYLQKLSGLLKMEESVLRSALAELSSHGSASTVNQKSMEASFIGGARSGATEKAIAKKLSPLAHRIARLVALRLGASGPDFFSSQTAALIKLISLPALKNIFLVLASSKSRPEILKFFEKKFPTLLKHINKELFSLEQANDEVTAKEEAEALIIIIVRDSLKNDLNLLHRRTQIGDGGTAAGVASNKKLRQQFVQKTRDLAKLEEQI